MKVLVTGATGFIGAQICRALVERGDTVRAFHRSTSTLRLLEGLPVERFEGDLTQPHTLLAAMDGMDIVFHTAGVMGVRSRKIQRLYDVIVTGTRNLLQAARILRVKRVVYTSSAAALGVPEKPAFPAPGTRVLLNENHTWNYHPHLWPYGHAKYLAEMEVQRAVAQGVDAVIVNPTMVIGEGDIYRQSSSIITLLALQRIPALVEGGINVVHVSDVVEGHLAALEEGRTGQRYILGGENLTLLELAENICKIAGAPVPQAILPARLAHSAAPLAHWIEPALAMPLDLELFRLAGNYFYYAVRKSQTILGLPPARPVKDALREAFTWFQAFGAIYPSLQNKVYHNVLD